MCLSVREHIAGTAAPIGTKFVCRSSVAVVRSSSGGVALRYIYVIRFMDDITFGRNGREAGKGWQPSYQRRRSITCATGAESDVYECLS